MEPISKEALEPHVNTIFRARGSSGEPVDLELVEVADGPEQKGIRQFTVLFKGPVSESLSGAIHSLRHDQLGDVEISIEPVVHEDAASRYYEAAFCHLEEG